jgi:DNA-binding NtrC family response regulator
VVVERPSRVLLVDDDSELGDLLRKQLERAGSAVTLCRTAAEALEQLNGASMPWQGAVIDLTLPDRSGLDLLRLALEMHPRLGVVIISGSPFDPSHLRERREQQFRFLQKPFRPADLVEALLSVREPSSRP